jgi:hypothetical protein
VGQGTIHDFNDAGQIVGTIFSNGQTQSFLGTPGGIPGTYSLTIFQPPGGFTSFAMGINNHGQIVGNVADSPLPVTRGYLRQPDGTFVNLSGLGTVQGINDSGTITGNDPGPYIGTPTSVPGRYTVSHFSPGIVASFAEGINNRDEIVGRAFDDPRIPSFNGFLRKPDGTVTKSQQPSTSFQDINDAGQIVGQVPFGGRLQGLVITEAEFGVVIPEPCSALLLATGLAGVGLESVRRRLKSKSHVLYLNPSPS